MRENIAAQKATQAAKLAEVNPNGVPIVVVDERALEVIAQNEEKVAIEAARPNIENITQVIVKPTIACHFELKQNMVHLVHS